MAAPVSYTEKTLADFMHAELGKTGSLLAYAVGAADAGSYQEAVNETLLNYGASTVDGAVDIQKLRALARVEAWRKAVGDLTTAYRFTSEGSTFDRGRLYQQAVETLLRAKSLAVQWDNSGCYVITVTRALPVNDPYRYVPEDLNTI